MVVKSLMSEFMMVISRSSRQSVVERFSPCRMLRTTVSGTKRAKASVPRCRSRNACCSSRTSLITARLDEKSSSYSAPSRTKSSSPRRFISTPRLLSGRETSAPRPRPSPRLSTAMPTKVMKLMARAVCMMLWRLRGKLSTSAFTFCFVFVPFARNAPSGITAMTTQRVRESIWTASVPTRRHLSEAPSSMLRVQLLFRGGSIRASSLLKLKCDSCSSLTASQLA
mmetsp:Transcript_70054/g.180551  ORF Transcript_70054/g.180551 Transcript_70054/m.180551 type:complete len:225 (-) Transcript_70054:1828-2502(-)